MSVIQRNRALLQQHAILSASPSKPPAPNVTVVPPTPPATPPSNLVPLTAEKTQTAETLQQQFISDRAARLKELSQEPLSAHIETITEKTSKILEALGIAYDATASIGDVLEALELRQAENQTAQEAQIRTLQTERAELRQQLEAALKALRCKEGNGKPTASSGNGAKGATNPEPKTDSQPPVRRPVPLPSSPLSAQVQSSKTHTPLSQATTHRKSEPPVNEDRIDQFIEAFLQWSDVITDAAKFNRRRFYASVDRTYIQRFRPAIKKEIASLYLQLAQLPGGQAYFCTAFRFPADILEQWAKKYLLLEQPEPPATIPMPDPVMDMPHVQGTTAPADTLAGKVPIKEETAEPVSASPLPTSDELIAGLDMPETGKGGRRPFDATQRQRILAIAAALERERKPLSTFLRQYRLTYSHLDRWKQKAGLPDSEATATNPTPSPENTPRQPER